VASPATIVRPSNEIAQEVEGPSAVSEVSSFPLPRSHTRSVWSSDAETVRRASGEIDECFPFLGEIEKMRLPHPVGQACVIELFFPASFHWIDVDATLPGVSHSLRVVSDFIASGVMTITRNLT
jgi:hypothetical protein